MHRIILSAVACVGAFAPSAHAQFYEAFDASFENLWGDFTFIPNNPGDLPFIAYEGLPAGAFGVLDGASVFHMSNALDQHHYVGMGPDAFVLDGTETFIEARVNTMSHPLSTGGVVFAMRIVSPGGPRVTVGLAVVGVPEMVSYWSSNLDGSSTGGQLPFRDDTWCRVRFNNTGPTLMAQILDDAGTPYQSYAFDHDLHDMQIAGGGLDLYLQVVQVGWDGDGPVLMEAAVDWVEITYEPCFADCTGDGLTNIDDVDCFVAAFLGGGVLQADCDGNGTLNVDDIDCFVASFVGGCP
ncbi:MAG: hypothetical protein RIB60_06330 [Phycisphaerales bacterium]